MPFLGITLAFWFLGGGLTILVHIIYFLLKKVIENKMNSYENN